MRVIPKYPPQKRCGLKPGTRVRVVREFVAVDQQFSCGEELTFLREMTDRDMGCDVWIFGTDESRRIEESLPEGGVVKGRHLWHELVHHKNIYGIQGLEDPSVWLANYEIVQG